MNKLFSFFSAGQIARSVYGESGSGEVHNFDPVIFQGYNSSCAIRSQQIILRDYGMDISQEQLIAFAEQNGWFSKEIGTPLGYVGYILQSQGVGVHQKMDCTLYDLVNELAQGHRVIVGVDSQELWDDGFMGLKGDWNDFFYGEKANHVLIVAGVEVDPNNPENVKVILTDPGTGDLRVEYDLDQFIDAWQDSHCFMVATDDPAPYQYDPTTGCEIPSNFYTEAFIENNSYPLSADDLNVPDGYIAENADGQIATIGAYYAEGHLDSVCVNDVQIDYDKYINALGVAHSMFGLDSFDINEFKDTLQGILGISEEDTSDLGMVVPFEEDISDEGM